MSSRELDALAARITQLEIGCAHQQRLCEQLNEVVIDHTQQLMRLEKLLGELKQQVKELRTLPKHGPSSDPQDERPPHY